MNFLTRFVTHFTWLIVSLALAAVVAGVWYGGGVFGALTASGGAITVEHTESSDVNEFTSKHFEEAAGDAAVLFTGKNGAKVDDPAFKSEVERLLATLDAEQVVSYYSTGEKSLKSHDGTKTYALVTLKDMSDDDKLAKLTAIREKETSSVVTVNAAGEVVSNHESGTRIEHDLVMAEMISLPILAVLLLFIFRGVIAALLPLLLGVVAIIGGLSVVRMITGFTEIDQYAINVITILGLGLSVDYSLLVVSRFREELSHNVTPKVAIRRTMDKAGHTILVSGLIVMASLLSLTIFPISFLKSVGLGGASALFIAILGALTLLPAILTLLGKRVNKWSIHLPIKKRSKGVWRSLGETVMKRPIAISIAVIAAIAVIASPLLAMQFKPADYTILPRDSQTYIVFNSLTNDFTGGKPQVEILYTADDAVLSPEGVGKLYDFVEEVKSLKNVTSVDSIVSVDENLDKQAYQALYQSPQLLPALAELKKQTVHDKTVLVKVDYKGELSGSSTQQLVRSLRAMIPQNATIEVGGQPAAQYDVIETVKTYLPYSMATIVVVMFILLSIHLRSLLIPLTAMVINTFALLATFGVLVWVFQWGNLTGVTWLIQTGGLDVTVPVLIFVMAFGLSMDYGVFLYSRIHEEYLRSKDTNKAILHGLEVTGPMITQAALLFFVVVAAFASSGIAMLQQIGLGLSLAVLLDAFVVRVVFIPAVMKLLGRANWWPTGHK